MGIDRGRTDVVVLIEAGTNLEGPVAETGQSSKVESEWQDKVHLLYTKDGWRVEKIEANQLLPYDS